MFLGQFRQMGSTIQRDEEPEVKEKPPESQKSGSSEEFIKTPEAKRFVDKWYSRSKDGKPVYTKRGVTQLLKLLFPNPGFRKNSDVLDSADEILSMLGGMDGLQGFLAGWKAKSEGIIKGIKSIFGG